MSVNIPMIVVTGGPCGGKSTFLARARQLLEKHGIHAIIVPEAATELITSGITPATLGNEQFQKRVLEYSLEKEDHYRELAVRLPTNMRKVILCDRGALDGRAYIDHPTFAKVARSLGHTLGGLRERYLQIVHLVTAADGAEEHYTLDNNPARSESAEEARKLDRSLQQAWLTHRHFCIVDNRIGFEYKMCQALQAFARVLALPEPMEIERKFRFLNFRPEFIPEDAVPIEIVQDYLVSHRRQGKRRVRQSATHGETFYYYAEKFYSKIRGKRPEYEDPISRKEYERLLAYDRDPKRETIEKTRYCFVHDNRQIELDVYTGGKLGRKGLVIVEVELSEEDFKAQLAFPDGWELEEVTDDSAYSNRSLAKKS